MHRGISISAADCAIPLVLLVPLLWLQLWSQPPLLLPAYRDDEYPPYEAPYCGGIERFTKCAQNLKETRYEKVESRKTLSHFSYFLLFLLANLFFVCTSSRLCENLTIVDLLCPSDPSAL